MKPPRRAAPRAPFFRLRCEAGGRAARGDERAAEPAVRGPHRPRAPPAALCVLAYASRVPASSSACAAGRRKPAAAPRAGG
ncbi:hypothetical protein AQ790_24175 [Burkholderia pseudomallei]|nr:hypothetical protein AQ790_24175 [Burkholderia pseudomallei]